MWAEPALRLSLVVMEMTTNVGERLSQASRAQSGKGT